MSENASSLLNALDSSFAQIAPPAPSLPFRVLDGNTPGSSSQKNAKLAVLAAARRVQLERSMGSIDEETPGAPEDALTLLNSSSQRVRGADTGGFRLHYDNSTPVRMIDIGGHDQQRKIAEFVSSKINNSSHGLTVKSAMGKLDLKDLGDTLPGLDVRLLPHQVIGVAWMIDQEKSKYKGGILGDDMGLGKTVQMIATMVLHAPDVDAARRTTLIVLPAALMQQWKDEIEEKTNGVLTAHIHHGNDKLKKLSEIDEYDVIITTYQTLNNDFTVPSDLDPVDEERWLAKNGGVLARAKFLRCIADEAQFIRNRATRASVSLAYVRAKYRWMLTGTPVTNSLADIYGLLRFGHFRPWNDWNDFNEHIPKMQNVDAVEAGRRAQVILMPLMLRRTKDAKLEGKPILNLPPKHIDLVTFPFSKDERTLYDEFEKQSKLSISRFIKQGTMVKNHHFILVMILRLRQLCCHPNLILAQTEEFDDPTQLMGTDAEKEVSRAIKAKGRQWVDRMKNIFLLRSLAGSGGDDEEMADGTCTNCQDYLTPQNGRILGCGHEICSDCTQDLRHNAIGANREFGNGSEKENMAEEKKYEEAVAKGWRPCPQCNELLDMSESKTFQWAAFQPSEEDIRQAKLKRKLDRQNSRNHKRRISGSRSFQLSDDEDDIEILDFSKGSKHNGKGKGKERKFEDALPSLSDSDDDMPDINEVLKATSKPKGKAKAKIDEDEELPLTLEAASQPLSDDDAKRRRLRSKVNGNGKNDHGLPEELVAVWRRGDDDVEESSKMVKLLEYLKDWEATGDKTIVYSQWTSMLDLLEIIFSRHGIRSLRFDGKMDKSSRDHTLSQFKSADGPKVILISTKSGGVGLNLVVANRIVNMDLSWNYASESQAYDRAYRIGQTKPVYVKRLVAENTIEERMLKLQDVKMGLAEAALGEGTGTKLHKLSMKDIKFLFGFKDAMGHTDQDSNSGSGSQGSSQ